MAKKLGRPIKQINWELLEKVCQFPLKNEDIAFIMDCDFDTLNKHVKEKFNISFSEYKQQKGAKLRLMLFQKQFEGAMKGNTALLIWLGKQYLDQCDSPVIITDQKDQEPAYRVVYETEFGSAFELPDNNSKSSS